MRDHLSAGKVAKVVQQVEEVGDKEPVFTSKGLSEYADELAGRILGEED
jgi:hypothetical protein